MFEEPETVAKWTDECYWVNIFSFCIGVKFVILKSAYSADILYIIHVIIDAIIFVKYIFF